jgi:hypothetical protein
MLVPRLGGVRAQAALAEGGGAEAAAAVEKWAKDIPPDTLSAFDRWPILVTSYEAGGLLRTSTRPTMKILIFLFCASSSSSSSEHST